MLAKAQRLRHERDILRVYKKGRHGGAADLHVKALVTGLPGARVAIVVSRKVHKHAVVRNRIRRRLFAQVGELWNTLVPGYDVVVTVRTNIAETDTAKLKQQLSKALQQSGALSPEKGNHV